MSVLMTDGFEAYLISPKEYLAKAVDRLCHNKHKGLIVMEGDKPIGVFTRRDMVNCSHCFGMHDATIGEFTNKEFTYCVHDIQEGITKSTHSLIPIVDEKGRLKAIFFPENHQAKTHISCPVVINAGGRGTRLYPYTATVPKPLVNVIDNKPMIELILEQFYKYSYRDFFMIVNHKKEMIKQHFNQGCFPYKVSFIDEDKPLGTGGGLYFLRNRIKETFFFSNCDIMMMENCDEIYEYHRRSGKIATMLVSLKPINIPYGVVQTDRNQNLISMLEKPIYMSLVNTGVYILEPDIFQYIRKQENIGFPDILARARDDGQPIGIYPLTADRWLDMGQIDELEYAKKIIGDTIRSETEQ